MIKTPKPVAFIHPASRRRAVKLAFPLEYDGREYREVHIRRPNVSEIAAWAESEGKTKLELYVDAGGEPIPASVFDGLDPDDDEEVTRQARDFLPRRLSQALFKTPASATPPASAPAAGADTAPMSEKSSAGPSRT
jgi:hypothetical protein